MAVCYMIIALVFVSLTSQIRSPLFIFPENKNLLRYSGNLVAAYTFTCGLTHLMRFILLFGIDPNVVMVFMCACVVTSSIATLYLVIHRKQLGVFAAGGFEDQRYHVGGVSQFQDQAAVTMALIACCAYGYSPSTLRGKCLSSLVHEEDLPIIDSMLQKWSSSHAHEDVVKSYRIKTAAHTYAHVESCCHWDELDGQMVVFVITRNIEQRVAMSERNIAVRCEWMRIETSRTHAMTLAHDLRTPLAIFQLSIHRLHDLLPASETTIDDVLSGCTTSIDFMTFIVDRCIDSCRALHGDSPIPIMNNVDIQELVLSTLHIIEAYPRSVKITFSWLMCILINLLTNACDATREGHITLTVRSDDTTVCFEVLDTGVGVNEYDKERLFAPFSKFRNKLKPEHGLGIGLYNCAWRVRLLGGKYSMQDNPGGGSIFSVRVPHRYKKKHTVQPPVASDIEVLVIEDTAIFRKLFVRQLRSMGLKTVDEAVDGHLGLQSLKAHKYDIAFIDEHMPTMNGSVCLQQYREFERSTHTVTRTTCVIVSADLVALEDVEADEFIQKPVDWRKVQTAIHKVSTFKASRGAGGAGGGA
eukprot:5265-Heterococcus_DN1.PRE.30